MFGLEPQQKGFLLNAITRGEAFLVLGAGASKTSTDKDGKELLLGGELAAEIARRSSIAYNKETLRQVISACVPRILSYDQLHDVLEELYVGTTPSAELTNLFNFSWHRAYSWNIDDTIENIRPGVQRRKFFNGMNEKVWAGGGIDTLSVIHLHGEALKREHGFIFSEYEYNKVLIEGRHEWYRRLAQDYATKVPIFIGSSLDEPILSLELDRARPSPDAGLGMAYLVSTGSLSDVARLSLASRNIVYMQGTLEDFTNFLTKEIGRSHAPAQVVSSLSNFAARAVKARRAEGADLQVAKSIFQISWSSVRAESEQYTPEVQERAARAFLEGCPPGWRIAASDVPVWLAQTDQLYNFLNRSFYDRIRLGVIVGQAGSGKSTALMQALLKYSRENSDVAFYEIRSEVPSLRAALSVIDRTVKADHVIVYVPDMFVYGDSFAEDVTSIVSGRMTVISSARPGEWRSHLRRHVEDFVSEFVFERFSQPDYQPLIDRLLRYVPSPALLKMAPAERRKRLAESQSQLLIALKETTYADAFTRVITDEYEKLPTVDSQLLLLICGLASIARSGVDEGAAREAFESASAGSSFADALEALSGIVIKQPNGRLSARHELYVRHLFENVADLQETIDAIIALLKTFTKYDHPVTKTVNRLDATLFRFLLNHSFIKDLSARRNARLEGLRIYQDFELAFQLDGHFWLQYGQYLSEVGQLDEALRMLDSSIRAYPENEYAWHSLADVQLKVAAKRTPFDAHTRELIGNAVQTLLRQDEAFGGPSDHYAIVTLAHGHVGALIAHKQEQQAREAAARYLKRITEMRKRDRSEMLTKAYEKLLRFTVHGQWGEGPQRPRRNRGRRPRG